MPVFDNTQWPTRKQVAELFDVPTREVHGVPIGRDENDIGTREEHLAWCKERALEYVDSGHFPQAWASMVSDLGKHSGTAGHAAIELGTMLLMSGSLNSQGEMRHFIEGFN